jgi:hypothetical protein
MDAEKTKVLDLNKTLDRSPSPSVRGFFFMEFWKLNKKVARMKDVTDGAKVLHSVISNLCVKEGYCFASNSKLGELCGVSARTIQRRVKELDGVLISVKHFIENDIQRRHIFLKGVVTGEETVTGDTLCVTPPQTDVAIGGTISVTHNREQLIENFKRKEITHIPKDLESNSTTKILGSLDWQKGIALDGEHNSWRFLHRQVKGTHSNVTLPDLQKKCTLFTEQESQGEPKTPFEWSKHFINFCKYQKFTQAKESSLPSATKSDWKK